MRRGRGTSVRGENVPWEGAGDARGRTTADQRVRSGTSAKERRGEISARLETGQSPKSRHDAIAILELSGGQCNGDGYIVVHNAQLKRFPSKPNNVLRYDFLRNSSMMRRA